MGEKLNKYSKQDRVNNLHKYLPELSVDFIELLEVFSDSIIILFLADIEDINSFRLIYYNEASEKYYLNHKFPDVLNKPVNIVHNGDISENISFHMIYDSVLDQENNSLKQYQSDLTGNYLKIESFPLAKQVTLVKFQNKTEIIENKRELWMTSRKYELILEKAPLGIVVQKDNEIKYANPKICEILDYSATTLEGGVLLDLFVADERNKVEQMGLNRKKGTPEPQSYQSIMMAKSGERVPVKLTIIRAEPELEGGSIGFITDLSETSDLRNQLISRQKLDFLNILAGGIAHDFNNLLTIINTNSRLLDEYIDDQSTRDYITNIRNATESAKKIIEKIKYLGENRESEFQTFDIYDIVDDVFSMFRISKFDDIEMNIMLPKGKYLLYGDPTDFHQVIMNLTLNSIEALQDVPSHAKKEIKFNVIQPSDTVMKIIHADTGIGITEEVKENLFAPFYSSKNDSTPHLGLGMSIIKMILEKYNADIWIDSTYDQGAKFVISVPIAL